MGQANAVGPTSIEGSFVSVSVSVFLHELNTYNYYYTRYGETLSRLRVDNVSSTRCFKLQRIFISGQLSLDNMTTRVLIIMP